MAEHIRRTLTGADLPPLGKNWVTKFTKRHPEIKSVMGARLDKERWNSVTRESMEGWLNLLKSVKEEYRILDSNIYNMDEKGCILGISEKARVLIPSSSRVKYIKQASDRESVTVIECIRSSGVAIPPFVIWKAHTHRDNWVPVTMRQSMNRTAFTTSPNGYTEHELGFEWLRTIFHPATVQSARGHTRLLSWMDIPVTSPANSWDSVMTTTSYHSVYRLIPRISCNHSMWGALHHSPITTEWRLMKLRNMVCMAFPNMTFYGSTQWLAKRHSKQKSFTLPTGKLELFRLTLKWSSSNSLTPPTPPSQPAI